MIIVLYAIEPHVAAHVQLKCKLTPKTEKDVIFKIQESIERTAQIKSVSSSYSIPDISGSQPIYGWFN